MYQNQNKQAGEVSPLLIGLIVAGVLLLGVSAFAIWAFLERNDYKNNTQSKVDVAVLEAKRQQSKEDNIAFADREKQPYRQFVGPEDLGRVAFDYPKTWSAYVDKENDRGQYEAYFQPLVVPPVSQKKPYALRITIDPKGYDESVAFYAQKVKKGELRSSQAVIEGFNGVRLDGSFSREVPQASMVIFKVRDKTMKVYTESPQFKNDYDQIILKSLKFNP